MKYSIGIDFGTESGRVLVVDVRNGQIKASQIISYKHKVIIEKLPGSSIQLPKGSALQHPKDYIEVLEKGIPLAIDKAGISPEQIIGLGVDFTSSTILPVDSNITPLCFKSEFYNSPHAWPKLWKHHHTKSQTQKLFKLAIQRKEKWLRYLGYNISEEWAIPKILETFEEDFNVYSATEYFLEASDWIVSTLTSTLTRNTCSLGFKAFWNETEGFPEDFFKSLNADFGSSILQKLQGEIKNVGTCAGFLSWEWSKKLSLPLGLPIATGIIDAHSALLGTGTSNSNSLLMVMGTSTCHLMVDSKLKEVPGISGVVKDGILPGLYAYEAGQSAVGDLFGAYVNNHIPDNYQKEAKALNISIYNLLERKASELIPGENGMFALDWHNGCRSILSNMDLTGVLIGLTLHSKPEEIFRAYLESTAYGAKMIVNAFEMCEFNIKEIIATGGLPHRNELLMQIYADVLNKPIKISSSDNTSAIGAAILGAVAAGEENGGYSNLEVAMKYMAQPILKTVTPNPNSIKVYETLFQNYLELHDYFGVKNMNIMKNLNELRISKKYST